MAIADKLEYLAETKDGIKTALRLKGVQVLDSDTFRSYVAKIGALGGGFDNPQKITGTFFDISTLIVGNIT